MLSSQRNSRSPTQAFRLILIFYQDAVKYLLISHYFFKIVFQFCCFITDHLKLSGLKQRGFISHCSVGLLGSLAPCVMAEVTYGYIQLRAWLWLHHQRQSLLLNGLSPHGPLLFHSMVGGWLPRGRKWKLPDKPLRTQAQMSQCITSASFCQSKPFIGPVQIQEERDINVQQWKYWRKGYAYFRLMKNNQRQLIYFAKFTNLVQREDVTILGIGRHPKVQKWACWLLGGELQLGFYKESTLGDHLLTPLPSILYLQTLSLTEFHIA